MFTFSKCLQHLIFLICYYSQKKIYKKIIFLNIVFSSALKRTYGHLSSKEIQKKTFTKLPFPLFMWTPFAGGEEEEEEEGAGKLKKDSFT